MPEALRRAQEDLAAGRPWKARERLRSYVNAFPTDDKALELLGEVHYAMGDLPAAGAAWILCNRDDDRTREAIEALREEPSLLRVRAPLGPGRRRCRNGCRRSAPCPSRPRGPAAATEHDP